VRKSDALKNAATKAFGPLFAVTMVLTGLETGHMLLTAIGGVSAATQLAKAALSKVDDKGKKEGLVVDVESKFV